MATSWTIGAAMLLATSGRGEGWSLGGRAGAGWYTAPGVFNSAEDLRPSLVVGGGTWWDRGRFSLGVESELAYSHREGVTYFGAHDDELLLLTSGVGCVGAIVPLEDSTARFRLYLGAGAVRSWNELQRNGRRYWQESWGPEFRLGASLERDLGRHGTFRLDLAGVNSRSFESELVGAGTRSSSDWSRVEMSLGWNWRIGS